MRSAFLSATCHLSAFYPHRVLVVIAIIAILRGADAAGSFQKPKWRLKISVPE